MSISRAKRNWTRLELAQLERLEPLVVKWQSPMDDGVLAYLLLQFS